MLQLIIGFKYRQQILILELFKNMTKEDLWQSVLAQVQFNISKANFATWFKNTEIHSQKNNKVVVAVPNTFSKEWLSNKYDKLILKVLRNIDNNIKEVDYKVKTKSLKTKKKQNNSTPKEIDVEQLGFEKFEVNQETNLNSVYRFDNFVVGSFNELAQAATWAVAETPGSAYNPLFIYGGVGLGKTHLLQAAGNKIVDDLPKKKVRYISCEKFISGIITSIKNKTIENFKSTLSSIDILVIDDVQFLSGKEKTQEEFFHLFNNLYEKNKQIVLSSDRPPKAIPELEERLRSRFEGGMIADVGAPDYETRLVILKTKLKEKDQDLPKKNLEFIASNIKKNIRELEGALNRLLIYKKINNKPPDTKVCKKLLKNFIFSPFNVATPKKIIETVANFYNLQEEKLFEKTRKKEIVKPRQIAMFLLREELKSSFPSIGRIFGGKDHTTAIYAHKKIEKVINENNKMAEEVELIKQKIYSG